MKRTNKVFAFCINAKDLFLKHKLLVSLIAFFSIGVSVGAVYAVNVDEFNIEALSVIVDINLSERISRDFYHSLILAFFSNFIYIFVLFISGYCAVSAPAIFFIIFFKGLGVGLTVGYIYSKYYVSGFLFCLLMILPTTAAFVAVTMYAAMEAFKTSISFCGTFINSINLSINASTIKSYNYRFLAYTVIIVIISALDAILSYSFSSLFNLF